MYRKALQQIFRTAHFPVEKYGPEHWRITPAIVGELRVLPYFEQWKLSLQSEWFHVKLEDHSLIIFDEASENRSFTFLHAPILAESFASYLIRQGLDPTQKNRREHLNEYEMLFETASARPHVMPIRFDFDSRGYRAGLHPIAHIHVGLENSIRLGVRRELSPVSFVLFVMRHMYPSCWSRLVERSSPQLLHRIVRNDLRLVPDEFWKELDSIELHLA